MPNWFEESRFGMFIHWSHISQRGWELSWPLVGGTPALPQCQDVPADTYHESAASFSPRPRAVRDWLEAAQRAGMGYAVFTAKHHDGFAMWHTRESDFSIEYSAYRGDLVREYVEAARELGIRIGLYFSLADWHHPDYPAFTDDQRPYSYGQKNQPQSEQWHRYLDFMFAQLRELLTQYGQIDLLWFDGQWERTPEQWEASQLHDLIRSLQPAILINDRLPGFGDFETPEQFVPADPLRGRWETCLTMNDSWGYNPSDTHYKPARDLVHALIETASRSGNLLLNVGPDGDGQIPEEQTRRLDEIGLWMSAYGETVIGAEPGLEAWQFYGPTTRKGDRLFLHLLMRPYENVTLRGVPVHRVRSVREVRSRWDLRYQTRCSVQDKLLNPDPLGELVIDVPEQVVDRIATVLEVEFES